MIYFRLKTNGLNESFNMWKVFSIYDRWPGCYIKKFKLERISAENRLFSSCART